MGNKVSGVAVYEPAFDQITKRQLWQEGLVIKVKGAKDIKVVGINKVKPHDFSHNIRTNNIYFKYLGVFGGDEEKDDKDDEEKDNIDFTTESADVDLQEFLKLPNLTHSVEIAEYPCDDRITDGASTGDSPDDITSGRKRTVKCAYLV